MSITNRNLDQQLEYTYKQIDIDVSATIDRFEINLVGRELYYESGSIDLRIYFQDKSRGFITLQPLRRITFADNKAFTRVIVETTTTSSTKSTLVVTSGDLIIQDYTAEISGTSNININQIAGDSNSATDMAGHFDVTNWEDYGGVTTVSPPITSLKIASKGTYRSSSGTTVLYTVPASQTGYIWYMKHTRAQSGGGVSSAKVAVSGGTSTIELSTLRVGDQQTTVSLTAPIRISAGDTISLTTDASFDSVFVVYLYQPGGF